MHQDQRSELRALALWHTRRREVDDLLEPLLAYGPVAVERVVGRLSEVRGLVDDERRAFEAFVDVLDERQQSDGVVMKMFGRKVEPPETREP